MLDPVLASPIAREVLNSCASGFLQDGAYRKGKLIRKYKQTIASHNWTRMRTLPDRVWQDYRCYRPEIPYKKLEGMCANNCYILQLLKLVIEFNSHL